MARGPGAVLPRPRADVPARLLRRGEPCMGTVFSFAVVVPAGRPDRSAHDAIDAAMRVLGGIERAGEPLLDRNRAQG